MSVPAFSDIAKPANDVRTRMLHREPPARCGTPWLCGLLTRGPWRRLQLLNKDFYHLSATTFEFKDTAPNGVAFKVTGKSSHEKATSAAVSLPSPHLTWRGREGARRR